MAERVSGIEHAGGEDDAALRLAAESHLRQSAPAQLVAELLQELRTRDLPWWRAEALRAAWPAAARLGWLRDRPDLRQEITTELTGLAPKACRKKDPDFQAALIDSVLDDGDIEVSRFEEAFAPADLAVYGPVAELWRVFIDRMPWNEDDQAHLDLVAWLLRALLSDRSGLDGSQRKPALSAWDLRKNIDGTVWHVRMPLEVRVRIDEARLDLEKSKPSAAFHAKDDLAIAVPELIAANIPAEHLREVFAAAERALGFERVRTSSATASTLPSGDARIAGSAPPPAVPGARPTEPGGSIRPKAGEARDQARGVRAVETRATDSRAVEARLAELRAARESAAPRSADAGGSSSGARTEPSTIDQPVDLAALERIRDERSAHDAPTPLAGVPIASESAPRTFPSAPPSAAVRGSQPPSASWQRTPAPAGTASTPPVAPGSLTPPAPRASSIRASVPPARPSQPPPLPPPPPVSGARLVPGSVPPPLPSGTEARVPEPDPFAPPPGGAGEAPLLTIEESYLEDENTNPWIVPNDDEIFVDVSKLDEPPPENPEPPPAGKRKRAPKG